jgi:hypothetical protein
MTEPELKVKPRKLKCSWILECRDCLNRIMCGKNTYCLSMYCIHNSLSRWFYNMEEEWQ